MQRSPIITVSRGRFSPTAAQVMEHVRSAGRPTRDEIAIASGLSIATVGRSVTQLVESGLLSERPDDARTGPTGRPSVPVEIDRDHFVTLGFHVGRQISTVALGDLTGRVLASRTVHRTIGDAPDLEQLSRIAASLLGTHPGRVPLSAALVAPWREMGLDPATHGAELHELTGLEVRTGDHISAVAASEFLHRRQSPGNTGANGDPGQRMTLYVYARDTIGWAVAVDRGGQTDVTRSASLTHFPIGSTAPCSCGRTGCLEATAGEAALAERAMVAGLIPEPRAERLYAAAAHPRARALLAERARQLGQVAGFVRDMVAPDRVVLVGQAFTGCPAVLEVITTAYDAHTSLDHAVPVSFTRFGSDIQAISACTVALGPVLDDPLAAVAVDGACQRRRGA